MSHPVHLILSPGTRIVTRNDANRIGGGQILAAGAAAVITELIYQTYNGYVMSQFKKLEQDLRARGEIKWKHAMHLLRLCARPEGPLGHQRPARRRTARAPGRRA